MVPPSKIGMLVGKDGWAVVRTVPIQPDSEGLKSSVPISDKEIVFKPQLTALHYESFNK